jgi:ribosomal protein S18 acetylase RimI-like enzyme
MKEMLFPYAAPTIPELTFRGFRGQEDYPAMLAVIEGSKEADGVERTDSLADIARNYQHLVNCDPYQDMLFVEARGKVVGYSRVWWLTELQGLRRYAHFAFLLPEWRDTDVRRAMLHHNERRLREIAADHADGQPRVFESWASDTETHWASLLLSEGYEAGRFGFEMVRPDLENIPERPLPAGLEVRPVEPEHLPIISAAVQEAFRDHWGYSEDEEAEELASWQASPTFMPHLWQIAWDGDQVVGTVMNFVDEAQNQEYGRKRGYTEGICVRRPWRRRGVAKALIARSFHVLKEQGMVEAALGVDADNPNGALQLYRSMGFQVAKQMTTYRKPLAEEVAGS